MTSKSTPDHRARWKLLGALLVGVLTLGLFATFGPSASAIQDPGIDDDDWNADFDGDWPPTDDADWPLPDTNPNLVPRCGIDIGVIVDRSGSIADAGQGANYKAGVNALIDAFAGTPSKLGLWSFANEASNSDPTTYPWHQLVDLNVPANVTSLHDTVDDIEIVSNFSTNWEEGLGAPLQAAPNDVAADPLPELWVVITDGNPTVHADDSGSGGSTDNDDMAGGIVSANLLKAVDVNPAADPVGTKVFAVGVGPDINADGLSLISGPTAYNGSNFATADYLTTSFADLEEELETFALSLCGAKVTVTKQTSTMANPNTYSAASGWTFGADNPDDDPEPTPASGNTNGSGEVEFTVKSAGTETLVITETQKPGFELVSASCDEGQVSQVGNTVTVSVDQGDDIDCLFRNRPVFIDLSVQKDDGETVVEPGDVLVYDIDVANAADATATATNVIITETVPNDSTFVPASSSAGWSCSPDGNAGATCTINVGSLAPGASTSRDFAVHVNDAVPAGVDQIVNNVSVTGTGTERDTGDQTDQDIDTLDAGPLLDINKDDNGATAVAGGTIAYDIEYTNNGNQAATNVVLHDTVPANTTFEEDGSDPGWSCNDGDPAGTECTLSLGTVNAGASSVAHVVVRVDPSVPDGVEVIDNTASITSDECEGTCDEDDEDTPLDAAPDLVIEKDDGGITAEPGDDVTYTIEYANVGDQDATGVVLTEQVPDGSTFVGPAGWVCDASGACTYAIGDLAAGASGSVDFTVRVDDPFPAGQTELDNVVVIDDDGENGEDPTPENNTDDDQTPVKPVEVEGEVVTPTAPQELPTTGQDVDQLLMLSGILLILGGSTVITTETVRRRRR